MSIVRVNNLKKSYPSFELDNVSFSLEAGRITGFIGRNGAGKTTTIKSILNLVHPDGGEIEYFGIPLHGNEAAIKKHIGYSTGTVNWYPRKKIKDIAAVMRNFYDSWDERLYRQYLKLFSLDENKCAIELSEGMKVKCNLLFALSHGAEALILDEPTSGLDPLMQREFFDILRERNQGGTTIFLSSHILSEIQRNCTRAAIVREGRMTACNSVEELVKTSAKRVVVHGNVNPPELSGIRDMQHVDNGISFLYTGDMNELVQMLSKSYITDLTVTEPDLEEIFMHYYQDGGDAK